MPDDPKPRSGEQRPPAIPPYPDNVAGERQVIRNWQIESDDNRMTREE